MALALAAASAASLPAGISAQVSVGVNASFVPSINTGASPEGLDGTPGIGGRGQIGIPGRNLRLMGSLEMFFPDCGAEDCEYEIGTASVLFDFSTESSVVAYLGAGLSVLNSDGPESTAIGNKSDWGAHLLLGARMGSSRMKPFVDIRYQLMPDFENQLAVSAGMSVTLWQPHTPG